MLDAVCTHVTSSAASRDSAVKLTTDSLGCTLILVGNFSIAYTVCKTSAKYGDAFSKSSSIHYLSHISDPINMEWSFTGKCICILEIRCRSSTVAELSKLAYIED